MWKWKCKQEIKKSEREETLQLQLIDIGCKGVYENENWGGEVVGEAEEKGGEEEKGREKGGEVDGEGSENGGGEIGKEEGGYVGEGEEEGAGTDGMVGRVASRSCHEH